MLATEILAKYREKVKSKNVEDRYAALTFALQIPSICSRIEFNDTSDNTLFRKDRKPFDKKQYIKIIEKNSDKITFLCAVISVSEFAKLVYDLRCTLFHEGYIFIDKDKQKHDTEGNKNSIVIKRKKRLKFMKHRKDVYCFYGKFGNEVYVDFFKFCSCMYDIAEIYFDNNCELENINTFLLSDGEQVKVLVNKINNLIDILTLGGVNNVN